MTYYMWRLTDTCFDQDSWNPKNPWYTGYTDYSLCLQHALEASSKQISPLLFSTGREEHHFEIISYTVEKEERFTNSIELDTQEQTLRFNVSKK